MGHAIFTTAAWCTHEVVTCPQFGSEHGDILTAHTRDDGQHYFTVGFRF